MMEIRNCIYHIQGLLQNPVTPPPLLPNTAYHAISCYPVRSIKSLVVELLAGFYSQFMSGESKLQNYILKVHKKVGKNSNLY